MTPATTDTPAPSEPATPAQPWPSASPPPPPSESNRPKVIELAKKWEPGGSFFDALTGAGSPPPPPVASAGPTTTSSNPALPKLFRPILIPDSPPSTNSPLASARGLVSSSTSDTAASPPRPPTFGYPSPRAHTNSAHPFTFAPPSDTNDATVLIDTSAVAPPSTPPQAQPLSTGSSYLNPFSSSLPPFSFPTFNAAGSGECGDGVKEEDGGEDVKPFALAETIPGSKKFRPDSALGAAPSGEGKYDGFSMAEKSRQMRMRDNQRQKEQRERYRRLQSSGWGSNSSSSSVGPQSQGDQAAGSNLGATLEGSPWTDQRRALCEGRSSFDNRGSADDDEWSTGGEEEASLPTLFECSLWESETCEEDALLEQAIEASLREFEGDERMVARAIADSVVHAGGEEEVEVVGSGSWDEGDAVEEEDETMLDENDFWDECEEESDEEGTVVGEPTAMIDEEATARSSGMATGWPEEGEESPKQDLKMVLKRAYYSAELQAMYQEWRVELYYRRNGEEYESGRASGMDVAVKQEAEEGGQWKGKQKEGTVKTGAVLDFSNISSIAAILLTYQTVLHLPPSPRRTADLPTLKLRAEELLVALNATYDLGPEWEEKDDEIEEERFERMVKVWLRVVAGNDWLLREGRRRMERRRVNGKEREREEVGGEEEDLVEKMSQLELDFTASAESLSSVTSSTDVRRQSVTHLEDVLEDLRLRRDREESEESDASGWSFESVSAESEGWSEGEWSGAER